MQRCWENCQLCNTCYLGLFWLTRDRLCRRLPVLTTNIMVTCTHMLKGQKDTLVGMTLVGFPFRQLSQLRLRRRRGRQGALEEEGLDESHSTKLVQIEVSEGLLQPGMTGGLSAEEPRKVASRELVAETSLAPRQRPRPRRQRVRERGQSTSFPSHSLTFPNLLP
jgi:hypothetical protein